MNTIKALAVGMGLLLSLSACGGDPAATSAARTTTSVQEVLPAAAGTGAPPPPAAAAAGRTPAPGQPPPNSVAEAAPGSVLTSMGTLPLDITLDPPCARRGATMAVSIRTVSAAALGLALSYADGDPHGAMHIDDASGEGSYVWRILVPLEVPPGPASVLVSSSNGKESAARQVRFVVAGAKGC